MCKLEYFRFLIEQVCITCRYSTPLTFLLLLGPLVCIRSQYLHRGSDRASDNTKILLPFSWDPSETLLVEIRRFDSTHVQHTYYDEGAP